MAARFEVLCEIDPPTRPDISSIYRQVEALGEVASSFLVPDNHLGRATVSSIAVAAEVRRLGKPAIACLNSRDRNLLGLRRDVLTAAAQGVSELLFVYGDAPSEGERVGGLKVSEMAAEARRMAAQASFYEAAPAPLRLGMTAALKPLPPWKASADFLVAQMSFSVPALCAWRRGLGTEVPVYAGVVVLASPAMARRLEASVPGFEAPAELTRQLSTDRSAGVKAACELVLALRDSSVFSGVHLVPVGRYAEVAANLSGRL